MSQQRSSGAAVVRPGFSSELVAFEMLEGRTFLSHAGPWGCHGGGDDLTVMSQNLYLGCDIAKLAAAQSIADVPGLVADAWKTVQQTDFPSRAKVIAKEVAKAKPELLGLQEAALWRVQEQGDYLLGNPKQAATVKYDFVEILIKELAKKGLKYKVASEISLMDIELPNGGLTGGAYSDIRLTDRDVILSRVDLPAKKFSVSNAKSGAYAQTLPFDVGGSILNVPRGWTSVDATVGCKTLHVVETHTEAFNELVQLAQTQELLAGPANSQMPTVLLGDFNSDVFPGKTAYNMMVGAGFSDAWTETHTSAGLTWGHNETLRDAGGGFTERDDLILLKGCSLDAKQTRLFDGALPESATGPLWASDHAGIFSKIEIKSPVHHQWWHGHKSLFGKGDDVAARTEELLTV